MKLNFGKRLILFIHWLISILLLAVLVFDRTTLKLVGKLKELIGPETTHIAFIAFAAVYVLLWLASAYVIFCRDGKRSERGFITVDSSETERVRIAISAIEQMVKQAVCAVDGIAEMKINISSMDDAIVINVNIALVAGSHVPTVTLNMQRAIRQFVEMNCGVSVRSVSVNIQSVTNPGESGRKGRRPETKQPVPIVWNPESAPLNEPAPQPDPVAEHIAGFEPAEADPVQEAEPHNFSIEQPAPQEAFVDPEAPADNVENME